MRRALIRSGKISYAIIKRPIRAASRVLRYEGRTVHIHFKIRHQKYDFTSQLYFDDAVTDKVHLQEPYAAKGQRTLKNAGDDIFKGGGNDLVLKLSDAEQGYKATFEIGLQT